ncbi:MAG: bifunctional 4-hydroxy-2-oxoglutarate aldolase/2-dehydro-3-deoxy-phosphogluconate aldolase [Thermoanaerobaculia bacterium]|nr:bifunctional 4-hydroxy-2-oxoglutarate aldolase/2-dehydro-3-deoxy-phosphogluconate aldolase [Thermoanaerobaculia bacterium]MCZ7650496.1 bifunctional 4-hydroxy-2-oxoglutarate aldolase/2-dehydro-3-deoxy-phosphogluconate aldolase [Thermoanaerobaculia bacterium]
MEPMEFVRHLAAERAVAILRCERQETGRRALEAAAAGGFRTLEVTLSVPGALELVRELRGRPGLVVGVGTVLRPEEVTEAVAAGAQFVVSPVFDPEVVRAAAARGVAAMPGCATPTEMVAASRAGAPLVKLFPAPGTGPAFVRACLAPLPFLRIVPTNGADAANAADWLAAGAFALGFTTPLFDPAELAAGRFDAVERRARELLAAVGSR